MDIALQKEIENIVYRVCYDDNDNFDIEFETESDREAYLKKFEDFELASYVVFKYEKCPCCSSVTKPLDCVGAIHAESASEALDYYLGF